MNTPSEGFALRFPYHQQFWHILKNDRIQKAHSCKQNGKMCICEGKADRRGASQQLGIDLQQRPWRDGLAVGTEQIIPDTTRAAPDGAALVHYQSFSKIEFFLPGYSTS